MYTPSLVTELRQNITTVFYDGRVVPRHTDTEHYYEDTEDGELYPSVTARTGILEKAHLKQWAANQAVDSMLMFLGSRSDYEPHELAEAAREARDAHKKRLDQASNWGTEAHDLVDRYVTLWINGERPASIKDLASPTTSGEAIAAALGAERFYHTHTLFPIVSEKKIISKKHKYGGTLDTLFVLGQPTKRKGNSHCQHEWADKGKNKIHCLNCQREEDLVLLLLDLKTSNTVYNQYTYANQLAGYNLALKEMARVAPKLHWILQVKKNRPDYEVAVVRDIKHAEAGFLMMNQLAQYIESIDTPLVPLKQKNIIKL